MGYRSDVAIAIYGPEEVMVPFIAAERLKPGSVLSTCAEFIKHFKHTQTYPFSVRAPCIGITAQFEDVKWYDSYPDVQAWQMLLSEASEVGDICTEFVRVGEEPTDVDTDYHGDGCRYLLTTNTQIQSDIPETTTYSEDHHDNRTSNTAS